MRTNRRRGREQRQRSEIARNIVAACTGFYIENTNLHVYRRARVKVFTFQTRALVDDTG